jgi:hypothetical protein
VGAHSTARRGLGERADASKQTEAARISGLNGELVRRSNKERLRDDAPQPDHVCRCKQVIKEVERRWHQPLAEDIGLDGR